MILNKNKLLAAAIVALLLFAGTRVHAQQAQTANPSVNTISYQGSIVEMDGSAVKDSIYPITVSIWTDATQGTRLWRDVFQTEVKGGIFNILLGSQIPLPPPALMDQPLWLGVSFNTDLENLPRFQLGTVPSAMNVADSAITSAKIADGAVQSASIADSAVTSTKIATGAVQSTNLADSSVTVAKMATDYVSAVTINGAQVTSRGGTLNLASGNGVQFSFDSASQSVYANVPLTPTANGDLGTDWSETGNFDITLPTQFLGTGHNPINPGLPDTSSGMEIHLEDNSGGVSTPDNVRIVHYQFDGTSPSITSGFGAGSLTGNIIGDAATSPSTVRFHGSVIAGGGATGLVNTISGRGNFDFIGSGVANTIKSAYSSLSGGDSNYVDTLVDFSYIGGGLKNKIGWYGYSEQQIEQPLGDTSYLGGDFIGAGASDTVKTALASIVGGAGNLIDTFASYSFIGGGSNNLITNPPTLTSLSAIVGGSGNIVSDEGSIVGAGGSNIVTGVDAGIITGIYNHDSATDAVIGSGIHNVITSNAAASFIGNGTFNWTNSVETFVGAGVSDSINAFSSGAVSGQYAKIDTESYYSFIGGGSYSLIDTNSPYSVVGGGNLNVIQNNSAYSVIGGGTQNTAQSEWTVIGGGDSNSVGTSSQYSFIGSGGLNLIDTGSPYSVIGGGDTNYIDISSNNSFIGGGYLNHIQSSDAVIAGGDTNLIFSTGTHSSIGGGNHNIMTGESAVIAGGIHNVDEGGASAIVGGQSNSISAPWGFIGSGDSNSIQPGASYGTISGGRLNQVREDWYETIAGGDSNQIGSYFGFIGGGAGNYIEKDDVSPALFSTIGGGLTNSISDYYGFVGGGQQNQIYDGGWGTIAGGDSNLILGGIGRGLPPLDANFIGGGYGNFEYGEFTVVGGGYRNSINASYTTIGGGDTNINNGTFGSILGGQRNNLFADYAAIGGGQNNDITSTGNHGTIGGGQNNLITATNGNYSTIPGGDSLTAESFAQTVIGYNNIPTGSFVHGTPHVFGSAGTQDQPLFIIGNGDKGTSQSDAFTVSYDGHSTAFDQLGGVSTTRQPVIGGIYNDNTVIAWGDIASNGTINASFGVQSVTEGTGLNDGSYFVVLNPQTSAGNLTPYIIGNASITVTIEENDTSGTFSFGDPVSGHPVILNPEAPIAGGNCAEVDATQVGLFAAPYQDAFIVHVRLGALADCVQTPHAFFFKVCAR